MIPVFTALHVGKITAKALKSLWKVLKRKNDRVEPRNLEEQIALRYLDKETRIEVIAQGRI